jgi:hypothetical protein
MKKNRAMFPAEQATPSPYAGKTIPVPLSTVMTALTRMTFAHLTIFAFLPLRACLVGQTLIKSFVDFTG